MKPPITVQQPVQDLYHGEEVWDPYRWLEEGNSPQTQAWTKEQNRYSRSILNSYPERAAVLSSLKHALGDLDAPEVPGGHGPTRVYRYRPPDQQQSILYAERSGKRTVIADPNQFHDGVPHSIDWADCSHDGRFVVYGQSSRGDEWSDLRIYDLDAQEHLADTIPRARYATLAWPRRQTTFYYTRYPMPGDVPAGEEFYHIQIFAHRLGTSWRDDPAIFAPPHDKRAMPSLYLSPQDRFLVIQVSYGWNYDHLYLVDLTTPHLPPRALVTADHHFSPLWQDERLLALTDEGTDTGQVVEISLTDGSRRPLVPAQSQTPYVDAVATDSKIAIHRLCQANSEIALFHTDGAPLKTLDLPPHSTVTGLSAIKDTLYYRYESFSVPPTLGYEGVGDVDWAPTRTPDGWLVTTQEWAPSTDGTLIPVFVAHRSEWHPGLPTPTVLTGYGGFRVPSLPHYSASVRAWVGSGGLYVMAGLRGGFEFGESWHQSGMRENKPNVFEDFYSVARYLIAQGYTDSSHLGLFGRSNGGLLTGATVTQHPDLAKAVVIGVPLLDMLRFHRFLIADLWSQEYGSPDVKSEYLWLKGYSPYHHVRENIPYPAILLYTAEDDTRVDPMHARKMTARLQNATSSANPVLLKVAESQGHGVGKSAEQWLQEETDIWTFFAHQLGLSVLANP